MQSEVGRRCRPHMLTSPLAAERASVSTPQAAGSASRLVLCIFVRTPGPNGLRRLESHRWLHSNRRRAKILAGRTTRVAGRATIAVP